MPSNKNEKTAPVRHAIARTTGATTWTRETGDEWTSTCLDHEQSTTAPNRGKAWTTGSHPEGFCPKCKTIAADKADKIKGDRLAVPADGKTSKKAPAKKATTTTPTNKVSKPNIEKVA